jgi:predicted RNA-binding protein with PIN domain
VTVERQSDEHRSETEPRAGVLLPEPVRARVVALTSDALGRLEQESLPVSLRRVAAFAPARRARLAATRIAAVLELDGAFRGRVAGDVREQLPELAEALDAGAPAPAAEPVELAAAAYLLRPSGWQEVVSAASQAVEAERTGAAGREGSHREERLRRQAETVTEELKESRRRHREQVSQLKGENAELRRRLGEAKGRARTAEEAAVRAVADLEAVTVSSAARWAEHDAEVRRLRAAVEDLERDLAAVRRAERLERGTETMRARLLLDTLLDTAAGLRRELALPAVTGSPADAVEAHVAEQGSRASSGQGSLASDDPALLDHLLALPRVHLVVDGYNVTKTAWPELPLERQRERLLTGLAPLAARSGAEVTVVFDAADTAERPLVNRPRGVRVLFSPVGVIADDVIRDVVAAEPRGRPVVVVSSDRAVAVDVASSGARVAGAAALSRMLGRV